MQRVFVLDTNKKALSPCKPVRARKLLKAGKAAVFKRFPFTIILKEDKSEAEAEPLRIKIDPGSKKTGIAILNEKTSEVVFAAELEHRGQAIKDSLEKRRNLRSSRRNRKTRHRKPRFNNRTRPKGWLPPSIQSRVDHVLTWVERFRKLSPIQAISQELVRFDMQQMENGNISGVEYQQGTLHGYEVREYLLEKWGRTCAYCGAKDTPLEIEHIVPKSKGGSNRISNLTLACTSCNQKKGNQSVEVFLENKPEVLKKIKAKLKAPLKDAAAVNASRWKLFESLKGTGLPLEIGSGGLTKYNRTQQSAPKTHWLDAAFVGKSTPESLKFEGIHPLQIKATGHGSRQVQRVDKFGFPRGKPKGAKFVKGFQTGDMVKAIVESGKKAGVYVGRVSVRTSGSFNISTDSGVVQGIGYKWMQKIHAKDGYGYQTI